MIAKAQERSAGRTGVRPLPGADRIAGDEAALQRPERPSEDPEVASVVYSTELNLPAKANGGWPRSDRGRRTDWAQSSFRRINVGEFTKVPRVGDKAPMIHTPTAEERRRRPLPDRRPGFRRTRRTRSITRKCSERNRYVLLFATPKFCQSRVCGPVVDVAEQAKARIRRRGGFHPHGDLQRKRPRPGGAAPGAQPSTCRPSRGCTRSTATGSIRAAIEGAFGTKLMDKPCEEAVGG